MIQKTGIDNFQDIYWLRDYSRRECDYSYVGTVGWQYVDYMFEHGHWRERIGLFSCSMKAYVNIGFVI